MTAKGISYYKNKILESLSRLKVKIEFIRDMDTRIFLKIKNNEGKCFTLRIDTDFSKDIGIWGFGTEYNEDLTEENFLESLKVIEDTIKYGIELCGYDKDYRSLIGTAWVDKENLKITKEEILDIVYERFVDDDRNEPHFKFDNIYAIKANSFLDDVHFEFVKKDGKFVEEKFSHLISKK